jgi:hypothetical protein
VKAIFLRLVCIASIATSSFAAAPPQPHVYVNWYEIRGRFIVMPKPDYPEVARRLHHSGTGLFRLYFDTRGEVAGIRVFTNTITLVLLLYGYGKWKLTNQDACFALY